MFCGKRSTPFGEIKCQQVFEEHKVWIQNVRFKSGKLAERTRRRKLVERCQEGGLGWGLGGALGRGQPQLVGSEVTNRCPSQPPTPGCYSFVLRVFISRTAKFLSNSDMQLGNPQEKKKKNRIIKPFQIWKCFLGWLDVMPIKEAAWLSVLSLLRDSLYIIHLFNSVRRLLHVKAVIVICLGGNILAHGGASKPSFQSLDCCGRTEILLRSFYQLTSDLGKLVLSECKLKKIWP